MKDKLCEGRSIFRRSCHCQGWASSEEQLPPRRGWDSRQDSGSHQEQEVASQEPETFRPGRVRQDVGAAWYVLFTQSDGFHAHKVSMLVSMTWVGISVARVTRAHYCKLILFGFGHIVFNNILVTNLLKIILTGLNLYLFFLDMSRARDFPRHPTREAGYDV